MYEISHKHKWSQWLYRMGGIWERDEHWFRICEICKIEERIDTEESKERNKR